jgi:hypothetical protein
MAGKAVRAGPDEGQTPVKSTLEVLLVYEDFATALRAKHSLDLLPLPLITDAVLSTRVWRLDLLGVPLLREQAALEAAAADLIIMSLHGRDELLADAREWLSRWQIQKEDRPYALAVLLDPEPDNSSTDHPVLAYMRGVATAASADLFYSFCQAPVPAPRSMPPTQGRGQALTDISLTGCPRNPPGT